MARKKSSKSQKYNVKGSFTTAGRVYHISPTEKSNVHEAWTTNAKPGSYDKKSPGMRRVKQVAYKSGAMKPSTSSINVTVVGKLKESEGIEFESPIDQAVTYTMDRDDLLDFLTGNSSSLDFANDMGSVDSHVWDGVSEISIEAYE